MIVQSIRSVGEPKTDLIFTIALDDVVLAREVLKELQQTVDIEAVNIDENMAKSIYHWRWYVGSTWRSCSNV